MNFQMNSGWEKTVGDIAVKAATDRFQPILDSVFDECAGQPVEAIKPVFAQWWAEGNDGASITDTELTNVAQAISDNQRVRMRDGRLTT